jgi:hypothetical protein
MNIKKITQIVSKFILVVFLFNGVLITSIVMHELSHKEDLKKYVDDDYICIVGLDKVNFLNSGGMYTYKHSENKEIINNIEKWTEYKAYSISFLIVIVALLSFLIYLGGER